MSIDQEYLAYILDMLEPLGNITSSKMFGGALIKSNGKQVGVIIMDELYFKIGKQLQEKYTEHGSVPFEYDKKEKTVIVHAWYKAPEEILEDRELFLEWAAEALASHT